MKPVAVPSLIFHLINYKVKDMQPEMDEFHFQTLSSCADVTSNRQQHHEDGERQYHRARHDDDRSYNVSYGTEYVVWSRQLLPQ